MPGSRSSTDTIWPMTSGPGQVGVGLADGRPHRGQILGPVRQDDRGFGPAAEQVALFPVEAPGLLVQAASSIASLRKSYSNGSRPKRPAPASSTTVTTAPAASTLRGERSIRPASACRGPRRARRATMLGPRRSNRHSSAGMNRKVPSQANRQPAAPISPNCEKPRNPVTVSDR